MNNFEEIIKELWKIIELSAQKIGSIPIQEKAYEHIENYLELLKTLPYLKIQDIKNKIETIYKLYGGRNNFEHLIPVVGKTKYDTSPNSIDLSIIAFLITLSACIGEINQKGLLSPQKEELPETVSDKPSPSKPPDQQKYILTVVISAKEINLINALRSDNKLTSETGEKLFQVKHWIYYDSEEKWKKDCESLFDKNKPDQPEDEYDVHYIKIPMDKEDKRFGSDSNMLKMYDAFKELSQSNPQIEISKRLPKESYENKGFYRV